MYDFKKVDPRTPLDAVTLEFPTGAMRPAQPTFQVSKSHELCINIERLCIKNEELCISNDEFCRRSMARCSGRHKIRRLSSGVSWSLSSVDLGGRLWLTPRPTLARHA